MANKGGKGARARRKNKKLLERKRIKRANRARWDEAMKSGFNAKKKKATRKNKYKVRKPEVHGEYNCGNIGCKKCFPNINK